MTLRKIVDTVYRRLCDQRYCLFRSGEEIRMVCENGGVVVSKSEFVRRGSARCSAETSMWF